MTFEKFDDINHTPLRVYNRVVTVMNLLEDSGKSASEAYLAEFDKGEQAQISVLIALIKQKGIEQVRKLCTQGLEIVNEN